MAEAIKDEFGIDARMIEGKGGIFDVKLDGAEIWSKHKLGRFPENDEVLTAIGKVVRRA